MQTATPAELQPGRIVGGYVIEAVIASGGMGTVYRARAAALDKVVALKVLHPSFVPEEDHLRRFLREARVAVNLDHPAVVKVLDAGNDGDLYFMAMEFVDGKDLKSLVGANGPFSPRKALRIARGIAEVLAYAHDKGLIHRDVKPANILITSKNEIKLADFGLARLCRDDHQVTMTGAILGTPAFMPPEQCRGDALDGRADLYSLGATLYFLLSGKLPFTGDNPSVLIHRVVNEPPPPLRAAVTDIPDDVAWLVQRLMAKLPSARFADGYEVIAAIDDILSGRSARSASPPGEAASAGRPRVPWVVIGLLAATAAVLALSLFVTLEANGEAAAAAVHFHPVLPPSGVAQKAPVAKTKAALPAHSDESPSFDAKFEALQKDAAEFIRLLGTGAWNQIDGYLDTDFDVAVDCRREAKEVARAIVAQGLTAVKWHTQPATGAKAWTVVVFSRPGAAESLTYTLNWTRARGAWYVDRIDKGGPR